MIRTLITEYGFESHPIALFNKEGDIITIVQLNPTTYEARSNRVKLTIKYYPEREQKYTVWDYRAGECHGFFKSMDAVRQYCEKVSRVI